MKSLLRITAIAAITTVSAFGAGSGSAGPAEQPAVKEKSAAVKEKSAAVRPVVKEESPAVRAYNEGVKLMQDKRFAQAQPKFEQAIKLDPDFAEAYNSLAFVLRKQGSANFPKSLAYYNRAIELKPKLAEAYMYRGYLYPDGTQRRCANGPRHPQEAQRPAGKRAGRVHANGQGRGLSLRRSCQEAVIQLFTDFRLPKKSQFHNSFHKSRREHRLQRGVAAVGAVAANRRLRSPVRAKTRPRGLQKAATRFSWQCSRRALGWDVCETACHGDWPWPIF